MAACAEPSNFKFLYDLNLPIKEKIAIICKEMYGAGNITYTKIAEQKMKQYEEQVDSFIIRYPITIVRVLKHFTLFFIIGVKCEMFLSCQILIDPLELR